MLFLLSKYHIKIILLKFISAWSLIHVMTAIGRLMYSSDQSEYGCRNSREISRVGKHNEEVCLPVRLSVCATFLLRVC